jgi:nitrite reductase/ring-hydroxylating ferredoxin subunit
MNSEDNQDLCRVGQGTPMGALMRRYWLPAALGSDLPMRDGDPLAVRLLGQDFVAFRDSEGRVGLLDEHCPHRRASLLLGRVGHGGIECLYHGWRFSVSGSILQMPNCDDARLASRYRANAYPVVEAGGIVWAYLGSAESMPEFPLHPWMEAPDTHRYTRIIASHSNFVQVIEGLLDSSHLGILHQDALPAADGSQRYDHPGKSESFRNLTSGRAPRMEVQATSFGLYYAALRDVNHEGRPMVDTRVTAFVAPFTVYVPFDRGRVALLLVPVDDEHTYFYNISWEDERPLNTEPFRSQINLAGGTLPEVAERWGFSRQSHGRPGTARRDNRWLQDRAAMHRGETYTGLPPFTAEDAAMTSSMGPISDRQELLVPADIAIVRMRRLMLEAARSVAAGGAVPGYKPGQRPQDVLPRAAKLEPGTDWRTLISPHAEPATA